MQTSLSLKQQHQTTRARKPAQHKLLSIICPSPAVVSGLLTKCGCCTRLLRSTAVLSLWEGVINKRERATCVLPSHFHSCSALAQIALDPVIIQSADRTGVQDGTQMMSADNRSLSSVPAFLLNACSALILMSLCRNIVPQFGK